MGDVENRLFELRAIKRTLSIAHSEKIDDYLNEVITSENRRKMWIAINGERMPNDIAEEVGVSAMAVSRFLKSVIDANLVEYAKGYPPMKIIDHVPSKWLITTEEKEV